jgi:hypothetical protein
MDLGVGRDPPQQLRVVRVPATALLPRSGDQDRLVAVVSKVPHGPDRAMHAGTADRREEAGDQ